MFLRRPAQSVIANQIPTIKPPIARKFSCYEVGGYSSRAMGLYGMFGFIIGFANGYQMRGSYELDKKNLAVKEQELATKQAPR